MSGRKQDELFAPGTIPTLSGNQLCFLDPTTAESPKKIPPLPVDYSSPKQKVRADLEAKSRNLLTDRPDFRRLVTYVLNKAIPVYSWFKYKEGFSRQLVVHLVKQFGLKKGDIVLDPFAGCGTTLLACKELGLRAIGLDVLPISVFVAKVKLMNWPDLDLLLAAVDKLMSIPFREPKNSFPDIRIVNLKDSTRERCAALGAHADDQRPVSAKADSFQVRKSQSGTVRTVGLE